MNISVNDDSLNKTDEENHNDFDPKTVINSTIRFWILLICTIPSIICSVIVLWLLLAHADHQRSLIHRIIIIQLISGLIYMLTNIPIYLNYLRLDYVWPQTPSMCQFSWFVGDGYVDMMTMFMVWASFERHIFIFHDQLMTTKKKVVFVHYLPISLIIIYYLVYYVVVMGFPPCQNEYVYTEPSCSESCLHKNRIFIVYETIVNDILWTALVAILSISLIIRVLWHNRVRQGRRIQWRKHGKIIIILLSISMIYLIFNLPKMILDLAEFFGLSEEIVERFEPYFDFLNYFIFISYPFICFGTLFKKFRRKRRNRIVGLSMTQQSMSRRPQIQ